MADPLSISLAAIALGTALKDLTVVALKLHDSFRKPARSMRAAESLAAETLEIVQDLEKFYKAHGEVLDNMPDVRKAVTNLLIDMQSVYDKCLPIFQLPIPPQTRLRRTVSRIELWMNRKGLESDVRDLRDKANNCYRRFMRHTQLGTAVAVGELRGVLSEGFSSTDRRLSALRVSDENVFAFMGSSQTILSTLPPGVMLSEDLVFKLHIGIHIDRIDTTLKTLRLENEWVVIAEQQDPHHSRTVEFWTSPLPSTPDTSPYFQSNIMEKILTLSQSLPSGQVDQKFLQQSAPVMVAVCVHLYQLGMFPEGIQLAKWAVELYRTLSRSQRDMYAPYFTTALLRLSSWLNIQGNQSQAFSTAVECLSFLKDCGPADDIRLFIANAVLHIAHLRHAVGEESSISHWRAAQGSVAIYERVLGNSFAIAGPGPDTPHVRFEFVMGQRDFTISNYAYALEALGKCLYDNRRYQEALVVGRKALALFRGLAQRYKDVDYRTRIASLCLFLSGEEFHDIIPLAQALVYARQSVQSWEEIQAMTRTETSTDMLNSVIREIQILTKMGRPSDALESFHKLARLVRSMPVDQQMYIHTLQDLSSTLFESGHFAEASMASGTVVDLCRQFAHSHSSAQQKFLVDMVLEHIEHCESANHLSEALIHIQEVFVIAGRLRMEDPTFADRYSLCFSWAAFTSFESGCPEKAIRHCEEAGKALSLPTGLGTCDSDLLDLITSKARALLRLGRLSHASETIEKGHDFAARRNLKEDCRYGQFLTVSSLVYRCSGKQDDALNAIRDAIAVFKSGNWTAPLYVLSDLQADIGQDAEALRTLEEVMELSASEGSGQQTLCPHFEHEHTKAQYSYFMRLFYLGDFVRARRVIREVRAFYEWHAHSRNAWFVDLAVTLRAEGILESRACSASSGPGDDSVQGGVSGPAAWTRLDELREYLRKKMPGVADQVATALEYEKGFGMWRRLVEKYPLAGSQHSSA
ncbi:hypothetical protein D9613_010433 [Agrocybe pediades]|uniref:Uncharacterized protein n=1 Tax=Agrocybe pediades TaxID=84607 RepID=A0A8H4VHX7_9AGAR|nr:hypothetical protein D9613_010433 [Agrocybe pediades]